jgi:hypothetical protein
MPAGTAILTVASSFKNNHFVAIVEILSKDQYVIHFSFRQKMVFT